MIKSTNTQIRVCAHAGTQSVDRGQFGHIVNDACVPRNWRSPMVRGDTGDKNSRSDFHYYWRTTASDSTTHVTDSTATTRWVQTGVELATLATPQIDDRRVCRVWREDSVVRQTATLIRSHTQLAPRFARNISLPDDVVDECTLNQSGDVPPTHCYFVQASSPITVK